MSMSVDVVVDAADLVFDVVDWIAVGIDDGRQGHFP